LKICLKTFFCPPNYRVEQEGKNRFARDCLEIKLYAEIQFEQGFLRKMQTKKKHIEIICETTTLLILKNSVDRERQSWCEQCTAEVFWIAPAEISLFGIFDIPEAGAMHTKGALVCSRSLITEINKGER
jgi:hypothetical protein